MRYYQTSHINDSFKKFTAQPNDIKPAYVLNIAHGLPASVLTHAEMCGLPAILITAVIDSHFVTTETIQAFSPIGRTLLGFQNFNFEGISIMPGFKSTLKDANQRESNIFT